MSRYRNTAKICSLFLILIAIAAAPLAIINIKSEQMLNKTHKYSLEEKEYTVVDSRRTIENIKIIIAALNTKEGITTRQEQAILGDEDKKSIADRAVEQLVKLREMKVLPDLAITENYAAAHCYKLTFMDANNPKNIVTIWEIQLTYADFEISLWMDNETSVIYQYYVEYKREFPINAESINLSKYMDYLGLPADKIIYMPDEPDGGCFIYSDEKTLISYRFFTNKSYCGFELDLNLPRK